MKSKFGITLERYNEILASQGGRCAICGRADVGRSTGKFHVDHSHSRGVVRGLLCFQCNVGLGNFGDNPDTLTAAANYLLRKGS